jgi:hypothetical protein
MDVREILVMISSLVAVSMIVACLLWARSGFIVSPKTVDRPAAEVAREQELIRQLAEIDQQLSKEFWQRYDQLVAKRKEETLVPDSPEHLELIRMTNELECRHAERLVLLIELAKLRKTSLAKVLKHSDVAVWNHG